MMGEENKISTSQLLLLLGLSRFFSLIAYTPRGQWAGDKITLLSTLLSGVLQFLALWAGVFLCRRSTGNTPLAASGSLWFRVQGVLYWGICMAAVVATSVNFISFMVTAIYDYRYTWVIALTFVAAGALAVSQGLEGLARGGGILAVLLGVGCAFIALGLWEQYDPLNFTLRIQGGWDTLRGAYRSFAMNGELVALLLLLPHLRSAPKTASLAGWAGALTLGSLLIQLMTMLTLGAYGGMKPYPVFTAVTSAGFRVFQRLDSIFLVIWVTLGVVKLAVFLALCSKLSSEVFFRPWGKRWIWGNAGVAAAAALVLEANLQGADRLYSILSGGAAVVFGVFLIPLAGRLVDQRRKRG